jgi:hydroxymethylpyrimidine/phosphomethylpyrimidine kinase
LEKAVPSPPPIALTLAGHDPSSGAGITADLLVFAAHGLYCTSAITALTVQSTVGVKSVDCTPESQLSQVLFHLDADLPAAGVKIGMLGSAEIVVTVAKFLKLAHDKGDGKQKIPCILDPVLISSSGAPLLTPSGVEVLLDKLLPLVDWITPNWVELAALSGLPVASLAQATAAAAMVGNRYPHINIVVTGGDQNQPTDLLRLADGTMHRFSAEHIETTSTHGTGCAFSSALLSRIILGSDPVKAVAEAKNYVTEAIRRAPKLGQGNGPLNLLWPLTTKS